ncbi:MAG: hypothetical protein IT242_01640, partial [Bacteroidia bacterium]|nr:hypothetical protein [Bacteroidia bacterium]
MNRMLTSFFLVLFVPLYLPAQTANWTALSPDYFPTNVSGQIHGISRISEMKFHPSDPNKMYAISARGGLFISTNAGASWTIAPGTDKMPSNRLASVCVDFTDDQIIYLGTGDDNYYYSGTGVWKSVNGGNTFTQTPMGNLLVLEMIMDPLDHNTIVAATNAGIYKTSNGGVTWTAKTSTAISFYDLVQNQGPGSRVMYAATYSDFYRSTDFGDTWTQITSGLYVPAGYSDGGGCRIGVSPANPAKVYFYMNSKGGTLFKSSDSGLNFVNIKDSISPYLTGYTNDPSDPGQGNYNTGFCVDRTDSNTVYYVGHVVWKSTNGGQTWSQLTNWWAVLHTDMHQMFVNPYNLSQLWNMNDGGVWLSTNGGSNWTPKSDGIYGYEIYHGYTSPTRKDMVSIGTQDNGELYYSGNTWYCNRGGDWSSKVAFDYFPSSSRAYYYDNARRRYVTGGESTYGLPVSGFKDIAFYPSNPGLAVVGDMEAYRTSNLGSGTPVWTQITSIAKTIKAVHISPADSNRVYIITNDQNLYVSTNAWSGTPVFTNYTLPSATSSTAGIISMKYNPDILYAVCNNKAYKSVNNGATWTNITYNLPSINFMDVLQDEYFSSADL